MHPEESRLEHYERVSNTSKSMAYDNDSNIDIRFDVPDDINVDLVTDIMSILNVMTDSLAFNRTYFSFVKHTQFFFIDDRNCFVLLDLNEDHAGLFIGRNKNNLYASKRFISNLAGKYSKMIGDRYSVTLDIKQLNPDFSSF